MPIQIDVESINDLPLIRLRGDLGEEEGLEVIHAATQALNAPGDRIIFDMSEIPAVTSGGLGALVRIQAQANTQEQSVVFASLLPFVRDVLQTTRLDAFLKLADTIEAAATTLKH